MNRTLGEILLQRYEQAPNGLASILVSADGSQREVRHAEEEDVEFVWLSAPEAFLGEDKIEAVRALRMHLGVPDATGRHTPQPIEDSSFTVEADMAIKALGFDPEDLAGMFGAGVLANAAASEALTSVLIAMNRRYKVPSAGIRITGLAEDFAA